MKSYPLPPPKPQQLQSSKGVIRQMVRGQDKPFDPAAPVARPAHHVYLNNPRRMRSNEGRKPGITDIETLHELLEMELESSDVDSRTARDISRVNKEIKDAARRYEDAVDAVLLDWIQKNERKLNLDHGPLEGVTDDFGVLGVMAELGGGASFLYYMEAEGHGIGTWDGSWEGIFKNDNTFKELSKLVKNSTQAEYDALHTALVNCAYELMQEHGIETMESNPRRAAAAKVGSSFTQGGEKNKIVRVVSPIWVVAVPAVNPKTLVIAHLNQHTGKWERIDWFKSSQMEHAVAAIEDRIDRKRLGQENVQREKRGATDRYYAQPYSVSATGFYFDSLEDFNQKFKAMARRGVEEFELQFIDGSDEDADLFKALEISQATIDKWFEEVQPLNEYEKAGLYALFSYSGERDLDEAIEKVKDDNPIVFEGNVKEYAENYIDDIGGVEALGEQAQSYFDYESYGQAIKNDILTGSDDEEEQERVENMSDRAIGEQWADDLGWEGVGKLNLLQKFFDMDKFANDLELGGDVTEIEFAGKTFVFDNNR